MTLAAFVALWSAALGKPIQQQMVILGNMSLGGSIVPVQNLAESLQVAFDAGAKRLLLPMASVTDIPTIPGELFAKFQTGFYGDPTDAVFKALGLGPTRIRPPSRSGFGWGHSVQIRPLVLFIWC
jgi:ATP-dependent Lon protease